MHSRFQQMRRTCHRVRWKTHLVSLKHWDYKQSETHPNIPCFHLCLIICPYLSASFQEVCWSSSCKHIQCLPSVSLCFHIRQLFFCYYHLWRLSDIHMDSFHTAHMSYTNINKARRLNKSCIISGERRPFLYEGIHTEYQFTVLGTNNTTN